MNFGQGEALTAKARLREELETVLTSELRLALDQFQSAISALEQEVAADASGASHPERSVRIERAKQAKAAAAGALQMALRRHNRFILDREVPTETGVDASEDPLDPPGCRRASASD